MAVCAEHSPDDTDLSCWRVSTGHITDANTNSERGPMANAQRRNTVAFFFAFARTNVEKKGKEEEENVNSGIKSLRKEPRSIAIAIFYAK